MSSAHHRNVLFILSDEHNRDVLGCYGDPIVQTPNLDALARRGVRFDSAYCASPICVPSRAALAVGRPVHQTGCWDNALPYHGQHTSWHHVLRRQGYRVASIGKLHFRSSEDDNGFSEEILPLHVLNGIGDARGLLRKQLPPKARPGDLAKMAGSGLSSYARYDQRIADTACRWLKQAASGSKHQPWALFVSFVLPHFPLIAPQPYFDLYSGEEIWARRAHKRSLPLGHPVLDRMKRFLCYDAYFTDETRRTAMQAYYGMVTCLDARIGAVLKALKGADRDSDALVIYASDHGDNLGARGLWGKSVMYEDAAAVPLLMAGAGLPAGLSNPTPVTLMDVFPTLLDAAELDEPAARAQLCGTSLFDLVAKPDSERAVLSQYHATGSVTGQFMVRHGDWKYVHYEGYRPQLFNLRNDPDESRDLGEAPEYIGRRGLMDAQLRRFVDPTATNSRALADQAQRVRELGGVDTVLNATQIGYTPAPGENKPD